MTSTTIGGSGQFLTIEVWSDVVCPFCRIGKRELELALERFPQKDSVHVVWKSFELEPEASESTVESTLAMLQRRYGITEHEARQRVQGVAARGHGIGLRFDFDRARIASSFHAHRLLHWATSKGKGDSMNTRLFEAYFTEGLLISDRSVLARLAAEIGLDQAEAERMLAGDAFAREVRADEREARAFGIRGVPCFVFDRRFAVSGAQTSEVLLGAMEKAWAERGK
jgi:predicted DsbA family dithiol-disulfide isomerase